VRRDEDLRSKRPKDLEDPGHDPGVERAMTDRSVQRDEDVVHRVALTQREDLRQMLRVVALLPRNAGSERRAHVAQLREPSHEHLRIAPRASLRVVRRGADGLGMVPQAGVARDLRDGAVVDEDLVLRGR
jgi:hypothetical protein